jgi:3-hydroxybutyryl-CoA dehydrogenase
VTAAASRVERSLARAAERGALVEDELGGVLARIVWSTELDALADCGLAVEAIVEDPDVKGPLLRRLDARLADDAVLASNTSSIPIAQLAAWTSRRERMVGLHFFSPVQSMRLVEIVPGLETAESVVARCEAFVAAIGKTSIRAADRSGFVVNALLVPYLLSAVRMVDEGVATREDVDTGMRLGAGHLMGPLALCDLIGLDVLEAVAQSLFEEYKRPEHAAPPLLRRMVMSGHLGRKTGRGFFACASESAAVG